jgi:hypothetical protein
MKTSMTDFKSKLNSFTGFSKDQDSGLPKEISNVIEMLIDDKRMMKNKNRFSFEQRTNSAKINLFRLCLKMAFSEYEEDRQKAEELGELICNATIEIEVTEKH